MKLNKESLQFINFFEDLTKAKVKDCFFNNGRLVFVVGPGEASRAVGIKGKNILKMEKITGKKVKVVEYNQDVIKFIRSFLYPIKPQEINLNENNEIEIKADSTHDKGILIGRDRKNLTNLKEVVSKYFQVKDIKII